MKQLARSRTNRVLAGLIGGMAESMGIHANLLRILYVLLGAATAFFPLFLLYIVLMVILPNEGELRS